MSEDILERAKKALIDDDMTYEDYDECISLLIAEVERLRSLNESLMENGNDLRTRCQKAEARIKELEADRIAYRNLGSRIEDLETYIERLEAAFLEQFAQGIQAPKEKAELMAREALERIRNGE